MKRYIRSDRDSAIGLLNSMKSAEVAKDPNTPPNVLAELANHDRVWVRCGVAENINTPPNVLAELANDNEIWVRCGVAENPNTPVNILIKLANDSNDYVLRKLAANPNTPPEIKEEIARPSLLNISKNESKNKSSWKSLQKELESDCDDGIDPLYEQTSAGSKIESLCGQVENKLGVWLESSIQGGMGGIWIRDTNDNVLVENYDYQDFNSEVISLALNSKNQTEFKNKYKVMLQEIIGN